MRLLKGRAAAQAVARLAARGEKPSALEPLVRRIIRAIRRDGDRALRGYAARWDGLEARQSFRVSDAELEAAGQFLTPQLRKSLRLAASNIRRFCQWQKPAAWTRTRNGISVGQLVRPLESVGCYVPGGRYPLVSTLLMTVIPAQVAGVQNIRVVSPKPSLEVLGAAAMLGVREFYRVGGAQAIAALAYGTKSVPRVDKIVGPGNAYVTAAKKLVSFDCAIDFLAGPTEAVVLSERGTPSFIAADLVAQGEHDSDALGVFITCSRELADAVADEVKKLTTKQSQWRVSRYGRERSCWRRRANRRGNGRTFLLPNTLQSTRTTFPLSATPVRFLWATTRRRPRGTMPPAPTTCYQQRARRVFAAA